MIQETELPIVFNSLLDEVNSLVEEYNSSRDIKLDFYSHPHVDFKVRRDPLPNGLALTVTLKLASMEFEVEHWRQASAGANSETEIKKLTPMLHEDGEVKFKYENGEPMSPEDTARSLMQPFFE